MAKVEQDIEKCKPAYSLGIREEEKKLINLVKEELVPDHRLSHPQVFLGEIEILYL